jgi:Zn-dependent oligopeptidase
MPFSIPEFVSDLPELMDLVNSVIALVEAEKSAVSFVEKQKLSEPVQEKLAALIDKVKSQAAS